MSLLTSEEYKQTLSNLSYLFISFFYKLFHNS